ncbi:outer membrane pore protein F [Gibbsiella quercinecans]|uniref:Porin n=1 Tax=Gibbsiella quercinecans TaxID=929813 RepID=A0A250B6N4_9GAMM|nr:porin [Gibbsiella quercinecans]ATA21592.1 hypothetical protein AWC35_20845 [Gibbsiella quercinecans]RLM02887.1 hypothetical protein BIY31_22730 [Gibbsiella quercinecans]RLM06208.1 hypothetical protein BIY30_16755 [Gibbsiella quercinecans]TCT88834.1 outer membrane pore protein F [Gibbsiella quercinecans]
MKKYNMCFYALCLMSWNACAAVIYDKDDNRLDLFGVMIGEYSDITSGAREGRGNSSFAQLGFNGQTQVNDYLSGFGFLNYRFYVSAPEDEQTTEVREAYAGLQLGRNNFISYGRAFGVMYNVEAYADVAPSVTGKTWAKDDNYMVSRTNSVLTYRNNDFLGLDGKLQLTGQFQAANEASTLARSNGNGAGLSLSYDFEPYSVIAGFSHSERTAEQKVDHQGDSAEAWAIGMKWEPGNFYFGTVYAETRNMTMQANDNVANKTRNFEIIGQYQFPFGLKPSLSWVYTQGVDLPASGSFKGGKAQMANYIEIGASYALNSHAGVYLDFLYNLLEKNDYTDNVGGLFAGTGNKIVTGVYYGF